MSDNIYLPKLARITHIKEEIGGERAIKTFRVELRRTATASSTTCGQCAMLSVVRRGEMMISIASSPLIKEYKQFSIMRVGRVSTAFHELEVGDVIGIRGPYGNSFPIDDWRGKNLVFIGGGVGLAPIWPVITTAVAQRADFKNITVFYGARISQRPHVQGGLDRMRRRSRHSAVRRQGRSRAGRNTAASCRPTCWTRNPRRTTPSPSPAVLRS